jgi:phospholipid/cholesterol/gamma-HCH transport system substrate-binding protein
MKKETRLGIFAFAIIALSIWGYNYLKGKNLLSRSQTFYVEYEDIGDLMISSPVKVSGFQIGTVSDLYLNKEDLQTVVAVLSVDNKMRIPSKATAVIEPQGVMGGAYIGLEFSRPCSGPDCAQSGTTLKGKTNTLFSKMLGDDQLDMYVDRLRSGFAGMLDTLTEMSEDPEATDLMGKSLYDTRQTLHHARLATVQLAQLIEKFNGQVGAILSDVSTLTSTLAAQNEHIATLTANTVEISHQVREANVGATITESRAAIQSVQQTVTQLGEASEKLNALLRNLQEGDGTAARIIREKELYTNLERSTRNLDLLLQDLRLNPKRYFHFSVLGKKPGDYQFPEADPADER